MRKVYQFFIHFYFQIVVAIFGILIVSVLLFVVARKLKLIPGNFLEKAKEFLCSLLDCFCCLNGEEEDEGNDDVIIRHLLQGNEPTIQINPSFTLSINGKNNIFLRIEKMNRLHTLFFPFQADLQFQIRFRLHKFHYPKQEW